MKSYVAKAHNIHNKSDTTDTTQKKESVKEHFRFDDNRPENFQIKTLQNVTNASGLVSKTKQMQSICNNSKHISNEGIVQRWPIIGDTDYGKNLSDAWAGFSGPKIGPMPEGRSELDGILRQYPQKNFFPWAVDHVNKGMGINTDAPLPASKSSEYIDSVNKVQSGDMTNTAAFYKSSRNWLKHGNYPAALLNLGGMGFSAMVEGMDEDRRRKTGQNH